MPSFRDLTPYEKEKWFDKYGRFEMDLEGPYFLTYGSELGEAFDGACYLTNKKDYGLSGWFVAAAQIQVLDMYYDQILLYTGEYGGDYEPEHLGLPPQEEFIQKYKEFGITHLSSFGDPRRDEERRLWDWAMEWREEHKDEVELEAELRRAHAAVVRLEQQLETTRKSQDA